MHKQHETLTTGVLRRNNNTVAAHLEVANFSPYHVREVTVYFFNWETTPPTLIEAFPISMPPSSNTPLDVDITSDHYEVRILREHEDVLVNCYGSDSNFVFQEGNTVLFKDLVEISK